MFNVTHTKHPVVFFFVVIFTVMYTLKIYITLFIINLTDDTANEQR